MINRLFKISLLALCFSFYTNYAQDIPPVAKYTPDVYAADNQNWSVTQTEDRTMFFANSKGLLKYDSERWELLGSPNNTILRSVYAIGNDVYSGAYMEFGVWRKNNDGLYKYHSLSKNLELIEDEQFWNITSFDNYVIFQSLDAIYIYNLIKKSFEIISPKNEITKMVVKDDVLYYHVKNNGLYKQVNGEKIIVNTTPFFKNIVLIDLYQLNNQLYAQTQYNGIVRLSDNALYKLDDNSNSLLSEISVYSSLQKDNGDIYLGTISQGLIKLSQDKVSLYLNQENSLSNNTVLSLFQDRDKKLWLGLDNGINCVSVDSSISIFNDQNGKLGTIYASIKFNGTLYLGTNQGLFYYDNNKYKIIKGTKGQVWSLFKFNDHLFCGHHNGTFKILNNKASLLTDSPGTWMFKAVDDKTIFTGNYEGLNVLKYQNDKWYHDRKIKGFDISTKYFEFIDSTSIIVNHEYKGVYKLQLNDALTQVTSIVKDNSVEKGLFSSIIKMKNKILYAYKKGIFYYDKKSASFKKDSILSNLYSPSNYNSGRLVKTRDSKVWLFTKTDINQISMSSVKGEYNIKKIPINVDARQQISGYENVSQIGSDTYLIGKSNNGYLKINTSNISNFDSEIYLKSVMINDKNGESVYKQTSKTEDNVIENKLNNITFKYTALNYNPLLKSEYQYKLKGYNDNWSSWKTTGKVNFKNLTYGDYVFLIRSRIGKENLSQVLTYSFYIERPFYLSNLMIILYILCLALVLFLVHNFYKRNYKKKKIKLQKKAERKLELKDLESQKEIMKIKNDKLQLDVENKNRELAIATMSLVKKNEFLSQIKSDLKPIQSKNKVIKKVLNTINNNLNNTDDWKFFEEAFNNADKDFFKKLKARHPKLTPNELKLCAYLRLNLTSKEIAPLFNISTKSVEIKRYRLRKKMNLSRNQSLTTYILSL
ncbi:MAG: hypothetical protein GVY05_11015 [Bacteroidetes bacterium]|nr:hypothetical protein [Bacteroidota bacterium]